MTVEKAFYYIEKAVDYYALPACDKAFALIKARIKELEAELRQLGREKAGYLCDLCDNKASSHAYDSANGDKHRCWAHDPNLNACGAKSPLQQR